MDETQELKFNCLITARDSFPQGATAKVIIKRAKEYEKYLAEGAPKYPVIKKIKGLTNEKEE